MKIQEIRKKTADDLVKILEEQQEHLRALKFRVASSEVKNHQELKVTRKNIARIFTILKEKIHV